MSYKIIDTIIIRGLQQFDKYSKLNPIEMNGNKIIADLAKYQKSQYQFLIKKYQFF